MNKDFPPVFLQVFSADNNILHPTERSYLPVSYTHLKRKKSFLCVGLDTDIKKIPEHLLKEEDPIFAFNKAIIDATADLCAGDPRNQKTGRTAQRP